jgi:uncharacterized caspase-like protein
MIIMCQFAFIKLYRLFLAAVLLLVCQPALADKRVALVIGNSAYQNVPALPNPVNDGAVIAATLKNAGFDVVDARRNLSSTDMRRALRDFTDAVRDADIAVVYYAGHGMEVDGINYLIPVDAKLERDTDVFDEAFSLERVLLAAEPAKQLRLVILDACRDNPFAKQMKRVVVSRAIGRGLAKVEPDSPNTLIAYSAKAGSTAQDGDGNNSPFALALAKHLTTPGLDIRRALGFVRDDVLKNTGNRQEPFVYGSLGGNDVPLVPARAAPAQPVSDPQADMRRDYELALQVGNRAALNAFLARYPDGFYASLARLQLEKIVAEEAQATATEKAKRAEQERVRLAATGAQQEAKAKADADARVAEQARVAAEQARQVAAQQAAEAERKRAEAAPAGNIAVSAAPDAAAAGKPPTTAPADKAVNVAALAAGPSSQANTTKSVQIELRRVGCLSGAADGDWDAASRRSLALFNRNAGTKLDVKTPGVETLDAIKQKQSRVCPLVCEHGYKADGDRCTRVACARGSFVNDDNECEKRREKPVARRERPEARQSGVRRSQAPASAPAAAARPLTGEERAMGCNTYQAIMSGRCP